MYITMDLLNSVQIIILNSHLRICLLILEREERGERKRERNINWLPPIYALTGDGTHNLAMFPDQESNPQPFGVWDDAPTESPAQIIFITEM